MSFETYTPPNPIDTWLIEDKLQGGMIEEAYMTSYADNWIGAFREPPKGPLDIQQTAKKVGVPVSISPQGLGVKGATSGLRPNDDTSIEIHLNQDDENDMKMTFGHELAHIFLVKNAGITNFKGRQVEDFCDYFGREVALPSSDVPKVVSDLGATVLRLSSEYTVGPEDVLFQMAKNDVLPKQFYIDSHYMQGPQDNRMKKIGRAMMCFDCYVGMTHVPAERHLSPIPVLDCTEYELHTQIPYIDCFRSSHAEDLKRTLNMQYGLWTEDDEQEYIRAQKNLLRNLYGISLGSHGRDAFENPF